jgi:hypothetical protein
MGDRVCNDHAVALQEQCTGRQHSRRPRHTMYRTVATLSANTLTAAVSLYFPQLKNDVQQINVAYGSVMMRFDEITAMHNEHREEDAVALRQRLEKELTPVMERVGNLMKKLGDLAQANDA